MCGWFDLKPLFLGRLRPERLTSNPIASQQCKALPGGTSSPSISPGPQWAGARIFEIKMFCFVDNISDLVHGAEAIHDLLYM